MTDQELLTYAAKAAGIALLHPDKDGEEFLISYDKEWNPLKSDADAFQLMVKLNIEIRFNDKSVSASSTLGAWEEDAFTYETKESTVKKMITRAAAEIGKGISQSQKTEVLPEDNYYKTQAESEIGKGM